MKRYPVEISVILLNIFFVAGLAIEASSFAGLVRVEWMIAAVITQVVVVMSISGIALHTNVRRPAGIDPNKPQRVNEEFASWDGSQPERRVQVRRSTDGAAAEAAKRLIEKFENEDKQRPKVEDMPQWALDLKPKDE
jgi:hypothetical protein